MRTLITDLYGNPSPLSTAQPHVWYVFDEDGNAILRTQGVVAFTLPEFEVALHVEDITTPDGFRIAAEQFASYLASEIQGRIEALVECNPHGDTLVVAYRDLPRVEVIDNVPSAWATLAIGLSDLREDGSLTVGQERRTFLGLWTPQEPDMTAIQPPTFRKGSPAPGEVVRWAREVVEALNRTLGAPEQPRLAMWANAALAEA